MNIKHARFPCSESLSDRTGGVEQTFRQRRTGQQGLACPGSRLADLVKNRTPAEAHKNRILGVLWGISPRLRFHSFDSRIIPSHCMSTARSLSGHVRTATFGQRVRIGGKDRTVQDIRGCDICCPGLGALFCPGHRGPSVVLRFCLVRGEGGRRLDSECGLASAKPQLLGA